MKIASILGVSRWTISRRVDEFGLSHLQMFSDISDNELNNLVRDFMSRHGATTGETFISGHFCSKNYHIQRSRIRASINRVDPSNTALRWGALVRRRTYVPWPNSLWHIDGHHAHIRWKFVIHGCCGGKSRKIVFLKCSTNNLSETVLGLFLDAIIEHRGLWPSRVRGDFGAENVQVYEAMINHWGPRRKSFIAESSTRNQRIKRLWRGVFRSVCQHFYYNFYAMEETGILDVKNPIHLFYLCLVFTEKINNSLQEFKEMFKSSPFNRKRVDT